MAHVQLKNIGTCPQNKVSLNNPKHFNMEGYELIESFIRA